MRVGSYGWLPLITMRIKDSHTLTWESKVEKSCVNFISRNKMYLGIIFEKTNMRTKDSQCHISGNKSAINETNNPKAKGVVYSGTPKKKCVHDTS